MKTTGIILLVLGILSTLVAIMGAARGHNISFSGIAFIVLGAFLMSRANKKKEEEAKRKQWESGSMENK